MPLPARNYRIEEYTKTVCPACFEAGPIRSDDPRAFVDGMLVSHGGKVWMRRFCPVHGESESLYEEDLELWQLRHGWSTPTSIVVPDRAEMHGSSPTIYAQGLPPSHGQHSCILLLNLTEHCNYACPTCYAAAKAPGTPLLPNSDPSKEELLRTVKTVLAREGGKLSVVMLSGGEPTLRTDLEEIIREISDLPVTRILLNTNGRRIGKDDALLKFLAKHRGRVEIYLQCDGFSEATNTQLRGENVAEEKRKVIQRLSDAGVFFTLVATVQRGLNETELGGLIELGLATPYCTGMAIQPAFGSGRTPDFDPRDRVTPTGILRQLETLTIGKIKGEDFIPLPCSHRDCCDIGYWIRNDQDEWKSVVQMVGREEMKKWIHLLSNTITFEATSESVRALIESGAIQRLLSEQQSVSAPQLARDLMQMCDCIPGVQALLGSLWAKFAGQKALEKMAQRTFRITVKMFMDRHTFHEARLRQCCVHTGTFEEDPRRLSFCWRWLFADASDRPKSGLTPITVVN